MFGLGGRLCSYVVLKFGVWESVSQKESNSSSSLLTVLLLGKTPHGVVVGQDSF